MNVSDLDLQEYCGLGRARFYVDPIQDAEWFFGNREVEREVLDRILSDLDVRGVPKCGVVGRFGFGKTHTLHHVKWLVDQDRTTYPLRPFVMDVVWDENNKDLNSWRAVHARMFDAMGEPFIREVVKRFDDSTKDKGQELSEAIYERLAFGDENLRRSLAIILADNFRREVRNTVPAWQWLKADKAAKAEGLGVPKLMTEAGDMVFTILNIGVLYRAATGQGLFFLMDEAQSLGNVRKADPEVHRAFLKLAEPDNRDVGFVLAIFGGGVALIPKVLTTPEDILSRLGVTRASLNEAFVELQRVLRTQPEIRSFMDEVLDNLIVESKASLIVSEFGLSGVSPKRLPFTDAALDKLAKALFNREENRNPRIIISKMAEACSAAYRAAKSDNTYRLVDVPIIDNVTKNI